MSREQAAMQALGAYLASQAPSITEETVQHFYHEDSDIYKCQGCGVAETKEKKHSQCSRCKQTRYCSKECQKSHWKEHKLECNMLSFKNAALITDDSRERMELFKEKFIPMMQLATYWELKQSAEDMIMIFELDALPTECKAPRLGIKSFRQESISSQPDFVQHNHAGCLIHAPPSDITAFALVLWTQANGEPMTNLLPFAFDDKDSCISTVGAFPRDVQIGIFHQEASKYVKTINDMARGGKKKLSKAAKPRRR
jgi:hypothetical protein